MALKPSLQCHKTFVEVGFPDKVTGLRAFETHLPYQKYQGPPIVVRCSTWDVCIQSLSFQNEFVRIMPNQIGFFLKSPSYHP